MTELHSNQRVTYRIDSNTGCNNYQVYELLGNNLIPCCPECEQGMHTRSQAKACKTQNNLLKFGRNNNKYYFSKLERFWRFLLC